jgi:hypothetical protein
LWKCSANLKQMASKTVDMLVNLLSHAGIHVELVAEQAA